MVKRPPLGAALVGAVAEFGGAEEAAVALLFPNKFEAGAGVDEGADDAARPVCPVPPNKLPVVGAGEAEGFAASSFF